MSDPKPDTPVAPDPIHGPDALSSTAPQTDLRSGVTPTQHAVLDMIEDQGAEWGELYDFEAQLLRASNRAKQAVRINSLAKKRTIAIEVAARMIDAADEIGRMIGLDGAE